jgi:hypothetical protein
MSIESAIRVLGAPDVSSDVVPQVGFGSGPPQPIVRGTKVHVWHLLLYDCYLGVTDGIVVDKRVVPDGL